MRAYPEEMLAEMASGATQIPREVEADPKAQMRFLDKEAARDEGLFYPSLLEDLLPAFERCVTSGVRFLDLGSGDGRAVFLAAVLGARATGLEYDGDLVEISRRALAALAEVVDPEGVRLVQGDSFAASWSGYEASRPRIPPSRPTGGLRRRPRTPGMVPVPGGSFCCGDLSCDSGETCANCSLDCSIGAEVCTGSIDEDCDGAVDCNDSECSGDPNCQAPDCSQFNNKSSCNAASGCRWDNRNKVCVAQ